MVFAQIEACLYVIFRDNLAGPDAEFARYFDRNVIRAKYASAMLLSGKGMWFFCAETLGGPNRVVNTSDFLLGDSWMRAFGGAFDLGARVMFHGCVRTPCTSLDQIRAYFTPCTCARVTE